MTVFVALTAGSILRHAQGNAPLLILGTMSIGLATAGPCVLTMRRRAGLITGRWGIGELAWLAIGATFLVLVLWNLLFAPEKAEAKRWLTVACVLCLAAMLSTLAIGAAQLLTAAMGAGRRSDRCWFIRRSTNVIGILLVVWFALLGLVLPLV